MLYLLCFDLSRTLKEQFEQVSYWLDFLNSALPLDGPDNRSWSIIIVGLRSDLQSPESTKLEFDAWCNKWPRLPIFNQIFYVSATTPRGLVGTLLEVILSECRRIFDAKTTMVPLSYRNVMYSLMSAPYDQPLVHKDSLFAVHNCGLTRQEFGMALQHLHCIGKIGLLKNGLVFTNPMVASKIAAKFVSAEEIQKRLMKDEEGVQILAKEEVGWLLGIPKSATSNEKYI